MEINENPEKSMKIKKSEYPGGAPRRSAQEEYPGGASRRSIQEGDPGGGSKRRTQEEDPGGGSRRRFQEEGPAATSIAPKRLPKIELNQKKIEIKKALI